MSTKPLVLGVLGAVDKNLNERRRERLRIAARAHTEGYTLLETFELGVNGLRDDVAAGGLIAMTRRHDVEAVLVCGRVDVDRLRLLDIPSDLRFEPLDTTP